MVYCKKQQDIALLFQDLKLILLSGKPYITIL